MTDQEMRIAIAEACGWSRMEIGTPSLRSGKDLLGAVSVLCGTPAADKDKPEDEQAFTPVPDYLNDLNACHEMEKTLSGWSQIDGFCDELQDITQSYGFASIHATARQRAEAFLRVKRKGKWV